jgi:hypothetical protein
MDMGKNTNFERLQSARARHYRAWLLRSWAGTGDTDRDRQYSLEDPYTGARRGFPSLAALVAYLQNEPGADDGALCAIGEEPGG